MGNNKRAVTGEHAYGLILAGGIGTRLWPKSREHFPKQFLRIHGEVSLLVQTVERLLNLYPPDRILMVCKPFHRKAVLSQITGIPEDNILSEPSPKGTAAAAIWGSLLIGNRDGDAVVSVFPSDHIIRPADAFCRTMEMGIDWAGHHDSVVVYGIRPDRPETNFGYIEAGGTLAECQGHRCMEVVDFHEKPDPQTAASYLRSNRFLWNSGIFTFCCRTLRSILTTGLFPAWTALVEAFEDEPRDWEDIYLRLPDDPFDTAVVEKLVRYHSIRSPLDRFNLVVFPCSFEWHDMGIWESYYHVAEKDGQANVVSGTAYCLDCHDSLIMSEGDTLVAAIGLKEMVAVCEGDAVLVCPRDQLDRVRELVKGLKEAGYEKYT
jgi:mannose-1-phosphate guanylyltransferase/mannose-6-phosphate isomerase